MKSPFPSISRALLLFAAVAFTAAARAGTWSTTAWTGDGSTHIAVGQTVWAYHFDATATASVNGFNVLGIAGPNPSVAGQFAVAGVPNVIGFDHSNELTRAGLGGSAEMARRFLYNGNPTNVTVEGLLAGQTYTVSFFGVDWANANRVCTFASGSDSLLVDEHEFGNERGIRVDYTFLATAATRAFTITPQAANTTWHFYALALRQETAPTTVTNAQDAGTGSLRWALANAAAISGANTITFDAALSGGTITTLSELTIADAGGVTIDASALAAPLAIAGGGAPHGLIAHSVGSLTLRRLRLLNGIADQGGAVVSFGASLSAFDCAFVNNQAARTGGALMIFTSSPSTVEGCTFSGNTTTADGGFTGSGGAITNTTTLAVRKSTLHGNSTTFAGATGPNGGAILNAGSLTLEHCTITGNTSSGASARGGVLLGAFGATAATVTHCIVAENVGGSDVNNATGDASRLNYSGANIVPTQANALFTGPAPLTAAPQLGALASNGGVTQTRAPFFGSPAIDAATTLAGHSTDQRGVVRPFDGDGNGTATPDLGAVEARFPIVSNGNDSGSGSLRQAVADAATFVGPDTIVFRSASFPTGGTVNLAASLAIPAAGDTAGLTLDTAVSGGNVDVATNAGTLFFRGGSMWTGGGRILLGATSGSAPATVDIAGPNGFALAAPITVRAGSNAVKTLYGSGASFNSYAGAITLAAPVTVGATPGGFLRVDGDVDLGPHTLTANSMYGLVIFGGRLFRNDDSGPGHLLQTGNGNVGIVGSTDNTRLTATVAAGHLTVAKDGLAGVYAVGGGLPASSIALTVAAGATADLPHSGAEQIADAASAVVNGNLEVRVNETLDALTGDGTVSASTTLTVGAGNGSGNFAGRLRNISVTDILSLTKAGTGTQTLSGDSSVTDGMTGPLNVNSGTLNITGSVALSTGADVHGGATLAGSGAVGGVVLLQSGGFIAPGDATAPGSIGTLNVSGSATWNGSATARFHLSATDNSSDRLALSGMLSKGSAGTYAFDFQGTGLAGQTYTLATFSNSTFIATDFTYTGLAPGLVGFFAKNATSLTFTVTAFSPIVANTNDSGPGSLRQVLDDAAHIAGANTITFPPALSGQTIALGSEIAIADATGRVTIDATNLPGGLTISGAGATRLFFLNALSNLTLQGLTLSGGNADGVTPAFDGSGGAIFNDGGTVSLTRCTLSGNAASLGGAIYNGGTLALEQCTFAGNSAGSSGGAIHNLGILTMLHCTVSGNSASTGGAVRNFGSMRLWNSIVAGNSGGDILNSDSVEREGANIVQALVNSGGTDFGPAAINASPRLAALTSNGGPTPTMALRPGSPALDAAAVTGITTDQRGFPRNRDGDAIVGAVPDIGAYEAQVAPVSGVGFNFVGGGVGGPGGTLAATDVAGVPAWAQANWNNLSTTIDGVAHDGTYAGAGPVPLLDASGAAFTPNLRLWWAADHLWNISNGVQSAPDRRLMNGYLDSNNAGPGHGTTNLYAAPVSQPFFAVAGLPTVPGGYKVIVYADGDATDRVGEYWLTTNRTTNPASVASETDLTPHVFVRDAGNFSSTYTAVPSSSTSNQGLSTPAGNYVVFEGLTEPAFILRAEEALVSAPLNAVQIVRNEIIVVTTAADELDANGTLGAGLSLREALRDAPEGAGILFDSTLNDATIVLDAAKGEIVLAKDVTIDASHLPGGLTVDGGTGANRIFTVSSGKAASLLGLTLTGGNGIGAAGFGVGGAIRNDGGNLALTRCKLVGNSAEHGGAIHHQGPLTLTLTQCTLSGNSALGSGGAIFNQGRVNLVHCTLAANSAGGTGGAIDGGFLTLTHCTLAGNEAGALGGAIRISFSAATLAQSIVAGNIAPTAGDILNDNGVLTRVGANLVQSLINSGGLAVVNGAGTISTAAPLLAPLADYGGPTQTLALLPGSPARDGAGDSAATSDQRGFPIVGVPDIGAYEAGTFASYNAFIWESLPATAAPAEHATTSDFDSDGATNLQEWLALTDPGDGASFLRIAQITHADPNVTITFYSAVGRSYTFESSPDLVTWTPLAGAPVAGTGSELVIQLGPFPGATKLFIRVRTGP